MPKLSRQYLRSTLVILCPTHNFDSTNVSEFISFDFTSKVIKLIPEYWKACFSYKFDYLRPYVRGIMNM